ncbi:MAG TPA: condensation domain-containing protein, partial [Flavobacteriales bacterium]|nr:condensation domain-containing protein [Flavobacteriales bacterium]
MEKFIPEIRYTTVDHDPFSGPAIDRTIPSTEAQREVFVASLMGKDASCAYNESVTLQLKGALDIAKMRDAISALIQRHEALRSCMSADGMRVIVQENVPVEMELIDLGLTVPNAREIQLKLLADADMTTPFDLLHGPMLRVRLIKVGSEEHLLRLTAHHVLVDGWSLGIMMADISKLYSGRTLDPVTSFSEYALAVIDHAKSEDHARTEQYWLDQFKGSLPR